MKFLERIKDFFMSDDVETKVGPKGFQKGEIWINNGTIDKRIMEINIDAFPGWVRGRATGKVRTQPNVVTQVPVVPVNQPQAFAGMSSDRLFLVEGVVRMQPIGSGRSAAQADQRRLVWAQSASEANDKFTTYFTAMTTHEAVYNVIGAAISEAIS
jgi:hypothetical protein